MENLGLKGKILGIVKSMLECTENRVGIKDSGMYGNWLVYQQTMRSRKIVEELQKVVKSLEIESRKNGLVINENTWATENRRSYNYITIIVGQDQRLNVFLTIPGKSDRTRKLKMKDEIQTQIMTENSTTYYLATIIRQRKSRAVKPIVRENCTFLTLKVL